MNTTCEMRGVKRGVSTYDGICRSCNDELFEIFWECH